MKLAREYNTKLEDIQQEEKRFRDALEKNQISITPNKGAEHHKFEIQEQQ